MAARNATRVANAARTSTLTILCVPAIPPEEKFVEGTWTTGWMSGEKSCSLARSGRALTMGSGIFSQVLYIGMQVLLPCLFNIAAVVEHL